MEPFVLKILKRLRKEAPRKFKDLRISCDELIGNNYYRFMRIYDYPIIVCMMVFVIIIFFFNDL